MKMTFEKGTVRFSFQKTLTLLFFLASSMTFTGCGGGDTGWPDAPTNTDSTVSPTQKVGYLVDSAVWGVDYSCGTITGTTKEDGEFTYDSSKCATTGIKFSIGNLILGTILPVKIKSDNSLTIQELVGEERYNVTNTNVIKIAVFLQSLDADNDVSNGIEIQQNTKNSISVLENMNKDIKLIAQDDLSNLIDRVGKEEVDVHEAVTHLLETTQSIDATIKPDIQPDPFSFTSKTNQETNTSVISDEFIITGIDTPTYITVSESEESMYNINGGDFTQNSSLIKNKDKIKVKHTTSTNFNTKITTKITIGGIVGFFESTTKVATQAISQSKSLLKTGQSEVYTSKDDGYYASNNIGVERDFTRDQTKEIVTDNATALQWQDGGAQTSLNWADASSSCQNLIFGGFEDWRLPTIEELASISDKSKVSPAKFDEFQSIESEEYWSSTLDIGATTIQAWSINFGSGLDIIKPKLSFLFVRCVRDVREQ